MADTQSRAGSRSIVPGLILVFLGFYFLLQQWDILDLQWIHLYPLLMLLTAGKNLLNHRKSGTGKPLFWALFIGIPGVFFLLRNYGILPFWEFDAVWPLFALSGGAGFVALYQVETHNPIDLQIGLVFLAVGTILLIGGNLLWPQLRLERLFWPIVLIAVGLLLLRSGGSTTRRGRQPNPS